MAFYGSRISEHISRTPEGYIICKDVPIGRAGKIKYLDSELGIGNSGDIITVNRLPEENMNKLTLASFEGKPITDGHPDVDVDSGNYNYYQKGHIQNVRSNGNYIFADLFITDEALINDVLNGYKREVSCGYDTIYKERDGYLYQTNIRGNHLAIVEEGRAGSVVSIRDSNDILKLIKNKKTRRNQMATIKNLLRDFKKQIRDADTIEEVDNIVEETVDSLEDMVSNNEPAPAPPPAPEPAPAQGGDPMAEIMAAIKSLNAKVESLVSGKPQSDGTPEGDLDKAVMELEKPAPVMDADESGELLNDTPVDATDEDVINEDDKGVTSASANETLEDVQSVDAKEMCNEYEIEENTKVAKDMAIRLIKDTRRAIAGISNEREKRRMADAVLKSVSNILKSKRNTARDVMRIMNNRTTDTISNRNTIENGYAKQNPHMSKKLNLGA